MALMILNTGLKTVLAIILLIIATRLMGRKALSQMTYFDFAVIITIGAITATIAVGNRKTAISSITALTFSVIIVYIIDNIRLKSFTFRKLINSEPVILIENGSIIEKNMRKCRITLDDLTSELREKMLLA